MLAAQDIACSPPQDINQPPPGIYATAAAQQAARPYFATFPDFGVINQIETNGNSNYNSLQTVLKVREWHRFTSQFTYTWAHGLDDMTAVSRNTSARQLQPQRRLRQHGLRHAAQFHGRDELRSA